MQDDHTTRGKVARNQVLLGERFKEIKGDDSSQNSWNLSKCFSAIST